MRIYLSRESDPMITDTVAALNATAVRLREFAASSELELFLPAETSGAPEPYEAFLPGVRFVKGDGRILVEPEADYCLRVTGSPANLVKWCSAFSFANDAAEGDHHHPEHVFPDDWVDPRSVRVIIEVHDDELHAP